MGIETIAGLGLGAAGLFANRDAQRKQQNAQNKANDYNSRAVALEEDKYNTFSRPALEKMWSLFQNYDPAREGQAGVQQATAQTEETIQNALKGLRADYAKGGGTPGQSSEYGVRAQGMTNRAADPLRAYLAEAAGNPTQKKMQMLMAVLGQASPGNMSSTYFNAAQNASALGGPGGDFTQVAQLISDAFRQKKPGMAGGGGRGDFRGQEMGLLLGNDV